jgi:hypothetical protein
MKMLLYLADFEELRIIQSLKEFQDCDKSSLVKSLWLHHRSNIKAVQLIAHISMDYRVLDCQLWENVLHILLEQSFVIYFYSFTLFIILF